MKKPSPVKPKSLLTAQQSSKPNARTHPRIVQPKVVIASQKPQQPVAVAPAVYCPQHMQNVLQRKPSGVPASPANVMKRGPVAPPVYRPHPVPRILQTKQAPGQHPNANHSPRWPGAPPTQLPARNGAGNRQAIQAKVARGGDVVQRFMTADELRWNASVQALKPSVDVLQGYVNAHTLAAQTLTSLRTLRDDVTESIRLRGLLNRALGSDPGHVTRLANERGFLTQVNAEIAIKEAAAAAADMARQNAVLAVRIPALPVTARWGRRT